MNHPFHLRVITRRFVICLLGVFAATVSTAWADPVSINPRPRNQMMGGAGLAGKGSKESASLNPAGLSDIEDSEIDIFPLVIEIPFEIDTYNSYKDFSDAKKNATSTEEKRVALQTMIGEIGTSTAATRFNFYPSYTRKYLHVGLLADVKVNAKLRAGGALGNQAAELGGSAGTMGLIMAGSYSFLENRLHVGLTLKPLYRFSAFKNKEQNLYDFIVSDNKVEGTTNDVGIKSTIVGDSYLENKAFGFGADLGMRYDLPFYEELLKPSVGLTYQDIGKTHFFTSNAQPESIEQSVSLGLAVQPTLWITKNTFAIDLRNVNEEQDFLNKLHIGAESVLWNFLAFRVGLSQGYFSGGVGVDLKYFQMDAYVASWEAGKRAHIQDYNVIGLRLTAAI